MCIISLEKVSLRNCDVNLKSLRKEKKFGVIQHYLLMDIKITNVHFLLIKCFRFRTLSQNFPTEMFSSGLRQQNAMKLGQTLQTFHSANFQLEFIARKSNYVKIFRLPSILCEDRGKLSQVSHPVFNSCFLSRKSKHL